MALQTSGPISLNDIQNEYGGTNPISISEYYGADEAGTLPNSGTISLSDFYGTKSYTEITATILLVAGGGAGGRGGDWASGGGGSGGEVLEIDYTFTTGVKYMFKIGAGGAATRSTSDGEDTVFRNLDAGEVIYRVKGGGGGGCYTQDGSGIEFKNSFRGSGACSKAGYNTGSALNVRRFSRIDPEGRKNGDAMLTTTSPIYGGTGISREWYSGGGGAGWGQPSSDGSDNEFARTIGQEPIGRYNGAARGGRGGNGFKTYMNSAKNASIDNFRIGDGGNGVGDGRTNTMGCGGGGGTYKEEKSDVGYNFGAEGGFYNGGRGGTYINQDGQANPTEKQDGSPGTPNTGSGGGGGCNIGGFRIGSYQPYGGGGGSGVAYIRWPVAYEKFLPGYVVTREDKDDNYYYIEIKEDLEVKFQEGNWEWP